MGFCLRETPKERRRASRQCAAEILRDPKDRLSLVLAGIASMFVSFVAYFAPMAGLLALYGLLGDSVKNHIFGVWLGYILVTFALILLLAAPIWLGMYRMALLLADGRPVKIEEIFHYVESAPLYKRALGISLRLFVCCIPAIVGFLLLQLFFAWDFIGFLFVIFFAISLLLSLLFVSARGGFVAVALSESELPLYEAAEIAAEQTAGERMSVLRFYLGMAFRMCLSLIPVALPFMLHTLPKSLLSAAVYARRMSMRDDI